MAELLRDNFNSYPTGSPPTGYTQLSHGGDATWSVEDLPVFSSRGLQASTVTTGEESLLKDGLSLANGRAEITVAMKGTATESNEQPGITLRCSAAGTWVQVRASRYTLDAGLKIRDSTGKVASAAYSFAANTPYRLVVEAFGSLVIAKAYQGSTLVAQTSLTTTVTGAGGWGPRFVGAAGGVMYFDDLLITDDTWNDLSSSGTVSQHHDLSSTGLVAYRSDLSSSGSVAATGVLTVTYEILPVGISNVPSSGTVTNHGSLLSSGAVAAYGSLVLSYEVFERPKITVALTPVADAFVLDAEPTLNYGDTMDLVIGRYDRRRTRAVLRFDLSSLRTDLADLIVSAYLRLTNRIVKGQGQLEAHEALSSWDEYGVTWANQPPRHPTALDRQPMAARVDLNILPLFMGWYRQTRANNGVVVVSADELLTAHVVAVSREWGAGADRPQLLVTYFMPEGLPGTGALPSAGVVGQASLYSVGIVFGVFVDLPSRGRVSQPALWSYGHVFVQSSLPSAGAVRGTRVPHDTPSVGFVSQPNLFSSGTPRLWAEADLQSGGYIYERSNLPASGQVRLTWYDDLPSGGYAELPHSDFSSSGVARVSAWSDLPSSGNCPKGSPQDIASTGKVRSQWLRSSGFVTITQAVNLWSKGQVRIVADLPSVGSIYYSGTSDLSSNGWPRLRDADDLPSSGWCRAHHSDLPSRGHIGPWLFEVRTTLKMWPPEGRSVR